MWLAPLAQVRVVLSAVLAAWFLNVPAAAADTAHVQTPSAPAGPRCGIAELPGLSRQYARAMRSTRDIAAIGQSADFWRVAKAILGAPDDPSSAGVDWATRSDLPCDAPVRARDRRAWQMALLGYSAKEIADVLGEHLTIADLRQAHARLIAGAPRQVVADFLDARWREPAVTAIVAAREPGWGFDWEFDASLAALAQEHRVPPALVRAMVVAESGGNARAVSSAGAIGLMQLMPATAAALGVNPWEPYENLRGGITYIAGLLRAYGEDARLALIAYNAGPQHANRVRAGTAVAYRETRRYLDAIAARYPIP